MENQNKLETAIGNKEMETLKPAKVKIIDAKVDLIKNKEGKEVGDKAIFISKHPDKEDTIEISNIKYLKASSIKESATWYNEDSDGNISKGSALGQFLIFHNAQNVKGMIGKEDIETVTDENGYLCFKAY